MPFAVGNDQRSGIWPGSDLHQPLLHRARDVLKRAVHLGPLLGRHYDSGRSKCYRFHRLSDCFSRERRQTMHLSAAGVIDCDLNEAQCSFRQTFIFSVDQAELPGHWLGRN